MTYSAHYKEEAIRNYITVLDQNNISVSNLKNDISKLVGEIPGIQLDYTKEKIISEKIGGKSKVVEKVKSITVAYTDGEIEGIPQVHQKTFYLK